MVVTLFAAVFGVGIFGEKPGPRLLFQLLNTGTSTGTKNGLGRISLAISKKRPGVIRLLRDDSGERFPFVREKEDRGWGKAWSAPLPMVPNDGQLSFNNAIVADPSNPDSVYVGQVDLWNATDGGTSGMWTKLRDPWVHADFHDIVFDPGNSKVFYVANDGGVYKGVIRGIDMSWDSLTKDLVIGQCATVGPAAFNPDSVICGSWNNGNPMTNDGGQTWFKVWAEDGFQAKIDADR
jgi:hypothetical protein